MTIIGAQFQLHGLWRVIRYNNTRKMRSGNNYVSINRDYYTGNTEQPKRNCPKWVKVSLCSLLAITIIALGVVAILMFQKSGDKQVKIYKFFINGHDGDSGANGEY